MPDKFSTERIALRTRMFEIVTLQKKSEVDGIGISIKLKKESRTILRRLKAISKEITNQIKEFNKYRDAGGTLSYPQWEKLNETTPSKELIN